MLGEAEADALGDTDGLREALAREVMRTGFLDRPSVLLLGGHVAVLPEKTLQDVSCSAVALGEGFTQVIEWARQKGVREKVLGLVYPELFDGMPVRTGAAPPLIDRVPRVAYDLMDASKYRAHNHHALTGARSPYASIYASLGCPYRCGFCCIGAPFRDGKPNTTKGSNPYRLKSVDVVIEEIDWLVDNWGAHTIRFDDEMFGLNSAWLDELCDKLAARSYSDDLNLWAYGRIDQKSFYGMLDKMRAAGFRWLCYGIESVNDAVREDVNKGGYDRAAIEQVVRATECAGIEVLANYIVGLPDDTEATIKDTVDFACGLNTAWANFYSCMPYVGSALYEQTAREHPEWLPETWDGYSQHSFTTKPLPTKTLSAADVLRLRDAAHRRYFERPEFIEMLARKFGRKGVEIVESMNGVKLRRKLLGDAEA